MTTIDDLTMTPKCAGSTGKCLPEAMEPWFPPKLCSLQLTKLGVESPWHHPCNQCATNVMISNLKPRIVKSTIDILVIISVYHLAKQKLGLGNPEQNMKILQDLTMGRSPWPYDHLWPMKMDLETTHVLIIAPSARWRPRLVSKPLSSAQKCDKLEAAGWPKAATKT